MAQITAAVDSVTCTETFSWGVKFAQLWTIWKTQKKERKMKLVVGLPTKARLLAVLSSESLFSV